MTTPSRQFNLVDDELLRYKFLYKWDKAMHHVEMAYSFLQSGQVTFNYLKNQYVSLKHEGDKVIVFERGNLLWIFNFHPINSYTDYRVGTNWPGTYSVVLNSDRSEFGGHDRIVKRWSSCLG